MGRNKRNNAPRQTTDSIIVAWQERAARFRGAFGRGARWVWDDHRRMLVWLVPGVPCPVPIVMRRWGRTVVARHDGCEIVSYPPWQQGPRVTLRSWTGAVSHRERVEWLAGLGYRMDSSRSYTYDGTCEYPLEVACI